MNPALKPTVQARALEYGASPCPGNQPGPKIVAVGGRASNIVLPRLTEQLASLRRQHKEIRIEVGALVSAQPRHLVLTSMYGVGYNTVA